MYLVGDTIVTSYGTGQITEIVLGQDSRIWVSVSLRSGETVDMLGTDILGMVWRRP